MPLEGDSKIFAKLTLICRLRTDQEQRQQEQPEQPEQWMQPFCMVRCAGRVVGGGRVRGLHTHTQTRTEEKQSDCKSAIYKYLKIP